METNTKTENINKVDKPKKKGSVYTLKRLTDAIAQISETDLVTEEEVIELKKTANKIGYRYMGIEQRIK